MQHIILLNMYKVKNMGEREDDWEEEEEDWDVEEY